MVCSSAAVVAALRIDLHQWTVGYPFTEATPLTFATAGGAFLLCTRVFRTPAIYVASIGLIFAAFHAATAIAWSQEDFQGQTQLVHLLLAVGLSLVSCCMAVICASTLNRRMKGGDDPRRALLLRNRAFYAGILQHFAFSASCVVLLALARLVIIGDPATANAAWMSICVSLLLAMTFSLSGSIYHSRHLSLRKAA